jgi:tetratricopeptide (TPR) repeat protein
MMRISTIRLRLILIAILLTVFPWTGYATIYFTDGITQDISPDTTILRSLYDSAKFYSRTEPVLTKSLLHRLIAIAKAGDKSHLHEYYTMYGNTCAINGEYDAARYYYSKALDLDISRRDTIEQIRIYNNLNYLYKMSGKLDLSLENAHEGIRLLEILKNNNTLPFRIRIFHNKTSAWVMAKFYSNIAQINDKVGNLKEAITYYKKALACLEGGEDKIYYASALNDIANVYQKMKQYDIALLYCQKAVNLNKKIDNEYGIGINYQLMGDIYAYSQNLNDAKSRLNEGLEILERSDDISSRTLALLRSADIEIKSGHPDAAQNCLSECFELIKSSTDLRALREYYYYKFKLDSLSGNQSSALKCYIKYHELDKQIVDVLLSQRIAEIQSKFEIKQKEQENKLLKTENEIQRVNINKSRTIIFLLCGFFGLASILAFLTLRHQRLITSNKIIELKQKNLNQQMNPHFVYNCLTSVQSYIFQNNTEKSLDYLTKFSRLMRKILESSQKQYMSVHDEIELLSLYLKLQSIRFRGKFDYNIIVDEKIDPILFKIPSFLIQPFVENSLWHGIQNKQDKGKLMITFNLVNKSILCIVEDNGIGREYAEKIKLNRISDHISLGSSITQSRMKLLKSLYGSKLGIRYIDLKDSENKPVGTRVELLIPVLN